MRSVGSTTCMSLACLCQSQHHIPALSTHPAHDIRTLTALWSRAIAYQYSSSSAAPPATGSARAQAMPSLPYACACSAPGRGVRREVFSSNCLGFVWSLDNPSRRVRLFRYRAACVVQVIVRPLAAPHYRTPSG